MKDKVNPDHGSGDNLKVTYISDLEPNLRVVQCDAHIFLLLLITAEDDDFFDAGVDEAVEYCITE